MESRKDRSSSTIEICDCSNNTVSGVHSQPQSPARERG